MLQAWTKNRIVSFYVFVTYNEESDETNSNPESWLPNTL